MGVSEGSIRKRVKRGTLGHDKAPDGRVYVYVDAPPSPRDTQRVDEGASPERAALISEMRDRIGFLERELAARSEEIARRDAIIMNMTDAMKALSPPEQAEHPRDAPHAREEAAAEEPEGAEPRPATEGAQEDAQPRSWWRR